MGRHTYFPPPIRQRALDMAKNRGRVANEWFYAGNKLTHETKAEFDRLMKQADKSWKEEQK